MNFKDIIPQELTKKEKEILENNLEYLFWENITGEISGIVIAGINKKTMKGSYANFELKLNTKTGVLINQIEEKIDLSNSTITIFAQNEVIENFFNGIDGELTLSISDTLKNYLNETLNHLINIIKTKNILETENFEKIKNEINNLKEQTVIHYEFEDNVENMKIENMKQITEEIDGMPKEELIEMAKTLIHITRLKKIMNSEPETVGKNVTVLSLSLKKGIEKFY